MTKRTAPDNCGQFMPYSSFLLFFYKKTLALGVMREQTSFMSDDDSSNADRPAYAALCLSFAPLAGRDIPSCYVAMSLVQFSCQFFLLSIFLLLRFLNVAKHKRNDISIHPIFTSESIRNAKLVRPLSVTRRNNLSTKRNNRSTNGTIGQLFNIRTFSLQTFEPLSCHA